MTGGPVRLVVDTNLFVAHVFRPGARGPARIIDAWERGAIRVCVSPAVKREMRATLGRLPRRARGIDAILERLDDPGRTETIADVSDSGFRCADPDDDKFLHLAIAANAVALVTSDRALLDVVGFPVPILKSGRAGDLPVLLSALHPSEE